MSGQLGRVGGGCVGGWAALSPSHPSPVPAEDDACGHQMAAVSQRGANGALWGPSSEGAAWLGSASLSRVAVPGETLRCEAGI